MTTAVDTNILLDVLTPDPLHSDHSEAALMEGLRTGALIISEPVYAELAGRFPSSVELESFLADTSIQRVASSSAALFRAGEAWRRYARRRESAFLCPHCGSSQSVRCNSCGSTIPVRQHVVADFIIGAHAAVHADRLLTRDRGYYATYFPDLELS